MQPLEKVQENGIGRNKREPKELTRVKKSMYIGDPERIWIKGRGKKDQ